MTVEERKKIAWLESYLEVPGAKELQERIDEWEAEKTGLKAQVLDGMPHSQSGRSDDRLVMEIEKIDALTESLKAKRDEYRLERIRIEEAICKVPNRRYFTLLKMRYLDTDDYGDRLSWYAIADHFGKSTATVSHIWHEQALKFIKIKED